MVKILSKLLNTLYALTILAAIIAFVMLMGIFTASAVANEKHDRTTNFISLKSTINQSSTEQQQADSLALIRKLARARCIMVNSAEIKRIADKANCQVPECRYAIMNLVCPKL